MLFSPWIQADDRIPKDLAASTRQYAGHWHLNSLREFPTLPGISNAPFFARDGHFFPEDRFRQTSAPD